MKAHTKIQEASSIEGNWKLYVKRLTNILILKQQFWHKIVNLTKS